MRPIGWRGMKAFLAGLEITGSGPTFVQRRRFHRARSNGVYADVSLADRIAVMHDFALVDQYANDRSYENASARTMSAIHRSADSL